jgi:DNA uptake protein ComE-like DNA-binding protein
LRPPLIYSFTGAAVPAHASAHRTGPRPGSRWQGKTWLLLTIPIGLTTWAAFLYVGIRARRPGWIAWAGVYAGGLAAWFVLDAPRHATGAAKGIGAVLAILTWIGGGIHAVAISNDAVRRISTTNDPVVEAAEARIDLRVEGKRLLATRPAIAREVGVGRPDVPGAHDYGLIDVNHCPATVLTRLPGITNDLARQIVDSRDQAGGYSSVEDLGMLLNLPPPTVDQLRDLTIFTPT